MLAFLLLFTSAPSSSAEEVFRHGGSTGQRQSNLEKSRIMLHESVSFEPLTFEAEEMTVDRERLLTAREHRTNDGLEAEGGDETDPVEDAEELLLDDLDDLEADARFVGSHYSSEATLEIEDGGFDFDDYFTEDEGYEERGEDTSGDLESAVQKNEWGQVDDFLKEGFSDIGNPITRMLRRKFNYITEQGLGASGDRFMTKLHNSSLTLGQSRRELDCSNVKIQFKTDKYGKETTVTLIGDGRTILKSARDVGAYQTKTMQKCVYPGTYTLKLQDLDGLCCGNGKGFYKMWVNGQIAVAGGYFVGSKTHQIEIGKNWQASMNYRQKEWLNTHNSRRRKYNGGQGYVALRWSQSLASRAQTHANRLTHNCKSGSLTHAPGITEGENLAKNQGKGEWGRLYPVDKIMQRWVEAELNWSYPMNAHMTQVLWRATQYVGCGESLKTYSGAHKCRVQVCRYVKAGNCAVRNGNWRAAAWEDDSACGSDCPEDGCFI